MIGGPGGVAGVPGAWYLSVPSSGSKTEAAKDFIAFAYEHNDLSADTSLGLVARKSAFESKAGEPGFENYPALLDTLEAPQTLPRPATAEWQEIVDSVLIPMLQKAVEPGADTSRAAVGREDPYRVDHPVTTSQDRKSILVVTPQPQVGAAVAAAPTTGPTEAPTPIRLVGVAGSSATPRSPC